MPLLTTSLAPLLLALLSPLGMAAGSSTTTLAEATLGGGCFWCLEAVYERMDGVQEVVSGYAGGALADPSYEQVVTGRTGHAEVVRIRYDPAKLSFDDLLEVFWLIHDPTTQDRQGNDIGSQYRSVILFHDETQQNTAQASIARTQASLGAPLVTELLPLERFYEAEAYHQDYFARNPDKPYCAFVVAPKVKKFQQQLGERYGAK